MIVKEGRGLTLCKDSYVTVQLSKDGKNIKTTLKKTKTQKGSTPVFLDKTALDIDAVTEEGVGRCRLQITLSGTHRSGTGIVVGGMSFSLKDIADKLLQGWFQLLPAKVGREKFAVFVETSAVEVSVFKKGSLPGVKHVEVVKVPTGKDSGTVKKSTGVDPLAKKLVGFVTS